MALYNRIKGENDDLVLFFISGKGSFPVVVPKSHGSMIKQQSERLEKQINAIYTGKHMRVEFWNNLIDRGINPREVVMDSLFQQSGEISEEELTRQQKAAKR